MVAYGLLVLPGIADMGRLYGQLRNELERLVLRWEPSSIRYVPAFINRGRTSTNVAEAMSGMQATLKLVAWDNSVDLDPLNERTVRKQVIGTCDFGLKDPKTGGIIPDSGRAEAKRIVGEWATRQGFLPQSHDVGDALVLLHFDPQQTEAKGKRKRHVSGIHPAL